MSLLGCTTCYREFREAARWLAVCRQQRHKLENVSNVTLLCAWCLLIYSKFGLRAVFWRVVSSLASRCLRVPIISRAPVHVHFARRYTVTERYAGVEIKTSAVGAEIGNVLSNHNFGRSVFKIATLIYF